MEVSKLLELARIKFDDPIFDNDDEGSLFKTSELIEYINSALREVVFRGKLIIQKDIDLNILTDISEYSVPSGVIVVEKILDENKERLTKIHEVDIEDNNYFYKNDTSDLPTHFFQELTPNTITIYPIPTKDSIVKISGTYVPIISNDLDSSDDLPVKLHEIYHRDLIYWVLYEGFSRPDADTYDPKKAALNEQKFIDIFGEKLHADQLAEIMGYPDDPGSMKDY